MLVKWLGLILLLSMLAGCGYELKKPIKVGILHSLTGTMAISEGGMVDALLLSIEEVNKQGGVLGRQILPVIVDGASNWDQFARQAEHLIVNEKVVAIFGCWTSASRKAVKPVVEKYQSLLFYPVQYEGLEQSPNIVYTGAAPNQQIVPSVHWALENIGKRVYLVGSDYIFPRTANIIIKDLLINHNIAPLGEKYIPLGASDVSEVLNDIKRLKPDLVFNTINGDSNIAFFKGLANVGKTKVLSFSIAEPEIKVIGSHLVKGHYAAWNYFQNIASFENIRFVSAFKNKFGKQRVINDPMEAAYIAVKLWAQAAQAAASVKPMNVKTTLGYQSYNAPHGVVSIDAASQHLWKTVRIGQVQETGQFQIVWSSQSPVRPAPYPTYHRKKVWLKRIESLGAP